MKTPRLTGPAFALALGLVTTAALAEPHYPVTDGQRGAARHVAETGVPLSELAPNAPDAHIVRPGDTLWDISRLFLRSPWRWPELWGMNLEQIRNPHLIYPGQRLVLVKSNGRARLQVARELGGTPGDVRLSPRVRVSKDLDAPIPTIPAHLLRPFLTDAVVLDTDELSRAPTIVAGSDGHVLMGRGDLAYVRGDLGDRRDWRVFRTPRPLTDPDTGELLGYEAEAVGAAELLRRGGEAPLKPGEDRADIVPDTVRLTYLRQEATRGDRLASVFPGDESSFTPRSPGRTVSGAIVGMYGEGVMAGQHQIVTLNRGRIDGLERGHVLALQHHGERITDPVNADRATLQLPDERNGYVLVFRVFERVSYGLVMTGQTPVRRGDRFTQP